MSLIRLLTTTRSLSDVKNEPSPYRMTEQGLLPKFGPKKQRAEAREDVHPPGDGGVEKENLGEGHGDRTDAGCSLKPEGSRKPRWLADWWQKLFRRRPRWERREPVQAEFTLDLVKVVRNDLSDADETRSSERGTRNTERPRNVEERPEAESVFGASRG
ncbi:MAG TPA: hypothetical protein VJ063_03195 [Verrucomicrobiae bacterium]|nr:hypothetical protein [Verrucomicrobiae bacterium]